jgi:hypothetical protein
MAIHVINDHDAWQPKSGPKKRWTRSLHHQWSNGHLRQSHAKKFMLSAMAESAALALGARIISIHGIQRRFFLTDNQLLVNFFVGNDHNHPPQWETKPFTQCFISSTSSNNARIFKIHRMPGSLTQQHMSWPLRLLASQIGLVLICYLPVPTRHM